MFGISNNNYIWFIKIEKQFEIFSRHLIFLCQFAEPNSNGYSDKHDLGTKMPRCLLRQNFGRRSQRLPEGKVSSQFKLS